MTQSTLIYATLPTPTNAAFATATTGGTLAAGTYYYRVSALDGNGGETLASAETSQATTGTTSTVTVNWGAVTGATGYNIYGRTSGAEQLLATVGAVTTWTDTGAGTPSGALPTASTVGYNMALSANVVVAAGATVTVGLYVASGTIPPTDSAVVQEVTPGADVILAEISGAKPVVQLSGPGTFRVRKPRSVSALGVFTES